MKKKIVIWGAGSHALVVADAIISNGEEVSCFVDTVNPSAVGANLMGLPVLTSFQDVAVLCQEEKCQPEIAIGFGHCAARALLLKNVILWMMELKTVVHRSAYVSPKAKLGCGVYVGPNTVVEADCYIGDGVILNSGSVICHESIICSATSICPGVSIGGKAKVGEMTWVGIGSTIVDKICVGSRCFIGAGAVVVKDIPSQSLAYGVPARIISSVVNEF